METIKCKKNIEYNNMTLESGVEYEVIDVHDINLEINYNNSYLFIDLEDVLNIFEISKLELVHLKIKFLSDLKNIWSADEMQNNLEEIHNTIKNI